MHILHRAPSLSVIFCRVRPSWACVPLLQLDTHKNKEQKMKLKGKNKLLGDFLCFDLLSKITGAELSFSMILSFQR